MGELIIKKNKKTTCIIVVACVLALCGAVVAVLRLASPLRVNTLLADRTALAENTTALKSVSDVIAVISINAKGENVLFTNAEDGGVDFGYTRTEATILNLFGESSLNVGDIITITEECYTTDAGTTLWTQQGYLPMNTGKTYLVFLKAYDNDSDYAGMYFPIDLEHGKYIIPDNLSFDMLATLEQNRSSLEIGDETDLTDYAAWYDEIVRSYLNETL